MAESPKHRDISRPLRADIATGRYAAGARLPGEPQLVKQFGVSRPTVGRALLDLQNEGLIERRAGSGTYVKDGAPAQAASSTRPLGLLIPGLDTTEIFQLICGEPASLARVHEYSLLWGGSTHPRQDTDASLEHAEELCQQFIERKVSGVKVPRDVRVVGFDDAKYATLVTPPLTTIHQPCRDIAVIAFRAMLERIAAPTLPARSFSLTPRLVVRESCGAYLATSEGARRRRA